MYINTAVRFSGDLSSICAKCSDIFNNENFCLIYYALILGQITDSDSCMENIINELKL